MPSHKTRPFQTAKKMQFSDRWKQLLPISSVYSPPLLITAAAAASASSTTTTRTNARTSIGPLFFNPSPKTTLLQLLFSSFPSSIFPPFPSLPFPRFLSTAIAGPSFSSLLPSTASSIADDSTINELSSSCDYKRSKLFSNSLQLLRCPRRNVIYAFFPAGDNFERIGFLVLSFKDSNIEVKSNNGCPFFVKSSGENHHRILKLLIMPVDEVFDYFDCSEDTCLTVGHMLAFTDYCVYWYVVKVYPSLDVSCSSCPLVKFVGSKCFWNSAIVHACWNDHLAYQSVVLLENGELYLFDFRSLPKSKKLQISWDSVGDVGKRLKSDGGGWLTCEFSWHPSVLIVAHSSAVFLVDMRSRQCEVSCLLKIEMFSSRKNDSFVALSKSGSDGNCFVVASKQLLLLCDVREPMVPLLRWAHRLDNLDYVTILRLSDLRSNSKEDTYKRASESGYCILLGSLLDCECSLFCYGPDSKKGFDSPKGPKICNFCAWGKPSDILLSGYNCQCGTCLVRNDFSKEALPRWIDWRQKKDCVMGFDIIDRDLSSLLGEADTYGGFSLVRLMFSGKLELQRYHAAWEHKWISEGVHRESVVDFEDNLMSDFGEVKYDLPKRFHFLVLDNLREYLSRHKASATVDPSPDLQGGYAVSLGDDTDNLSDGDKKINYSSSQKAISPDHNLSGVDLRHRTSIPVKKEYTPLTPEISQEPASKLKQEVGRLEIFDEGCPMNLEFDAPAMDFGPNELKIYKWLKAQDLKFQKDFKLNQEHVSKV